jgi:AAA15 family ATPase/GTPase
MLYLQEKGVQKTYSFIDASSGLKKALFLIVILYLLDKGSCVLIDNLGDGLDYKRSIEIVRILNDKAKEMQLIVCTNNESLLNYTDIRNWNVLHREGEHVKAFNYRNSKERILQFADSGLSNYEFFKEEYYFKGPDRL